MATTSCGLHTKKKLRFFRRPHSAQTGSNRFDVMSDSHDRSGPSCQGFGEGRSEDLFGKERRHRQGTHGGAGAFGLSNIKLRIRCASWFFAPDLPPETLAVNLGHHDEGEWRQYFISE